MKVYNEAKTQEMFNYDLEKGYLKEDKIFVKHHEAQPAIEEQGHRQLIAQYENGAEYEWVVDQKAQPAKEAYDEYEDIQVYIPYTAKELASREIEELKTRLLNTDYQAIKYAEGQISEEDYMPIRTQRQEWRNRINELEVEYYK